MTVAHALTGDDLSLDDVWAVAVERRPAAQLSERRARPDARGARRRRARRARCARAHLRREHRASAGSSRSTIPEELTEELQLRLLRSHACGVGEPYPDEVVRAAMLLRANALAKGNSGARVETVELLLECLNRGVLPFVPARGSVGASGDLAPLAHLALPLVGEGQAWWDGELLDGADALARAGLEPVRLLAKEGLSLINGTQFMAAQGALALVRAWRLARAADCACALSLEALQGSRNSFIPQVHALRPLRGQAASARNVLRLLEGSAIIESHRWCDKVQDAYSLRCAPQVHGASRDLLDYVEYTVTTELNSATDNPLVLVEDEMLVSAGNFHGQPLAFALDALAMAVAELASISERRVERLVNPNLSDGLPAFLTTDGGLNSGLHDPAVRRRCARLGEQVAVSSGVGRLDSDERRPGGSRVDGQRIRPEGVAGRRELRARARDRAARRRAGGRVPCAARAGPRRARDARVRPVAVAAAARRPVARLRHRGGGRGDSRRLAARRGRVGGG